MYTSIILYKAQKEGLKEQKKLQINKIPNPNFMEALDNLVRSKLAKEGPAF